MGKVRGGEALREEIHFGPAENQPDLIFCMFSMVSMMTTKSTTMVMAVVLVCSRGRRCLAEEQLLVVGKQVVQRHLAVNSCADDARSVSALKVSSHDLVELSVTQTHAF